MHGEEDDLWQKQTEEMVKKETVENIVSLNVEISSVVFLKIIPIPNISTLS